MLYKLEISYDGTNYQGWQKQKNKKSIQDNIEKALFVFFKEKIKTIGAGRTDAGVHAISQIATFSIDKKIDIEKTIKSLNALLNDDIKILSIKKAKKDFHPRYSATLKTYRYYLDISKIQLPFFKKYSLHIKNLDLNLLKKASKYFIGKKDFTSFANRGSSSKNMIKHIKKIKIIKKNNFVIIEFSADGFLYKMVRNIVGVMVEVSLKKMDLKEIKNILLAKNRKKAKKAMPPFALFLVKVHY